MNGNSREISAASGKPEDAVYPSSTKGAERPSITDRAALLQKTERRNDGVASISAVPFEANRERIALIVQRERQFAANISESARESGGEQKFRGLGIMVYLGIVYYELSLKNLI